jgi:hypothetical protein
VLVQNFSHAKARLDGLWFKSLNIQPICERKKQHYGNMAVRGLTVTKEQPKKKRFTNCGLHMTSASQTTYSAVG